MTIRAVRNNNPGNLEHGDHWLGLASIPEMSPEQLAETRFAVFKAPKWGFRALGVVLRNYSRRYGINTIRQAITRWAAPDENDTEAYIKDVCQHTGHGPDTPQNLEDGAILASWAKAISIHECGGWFFEDEDLNEGIAMITGGHNG